MVIRRICSAFSRSLRPTRSHSTSTASGSHCDRVSTTSATSGVSSCNCLPTMSVMLCDTATSPSHIQTPAIIRIRPAETWSLTSWCRKSALPPVSFKALHAASIDRATEGDLDHRPRAVDGQRLQVEASEQVVLPQRRDGIGRCGTRPHGHHEADAAGVCELMNDVRGQSV